MFVVTKEVPRSELVQTRSQSDDRAESVWSLARLSFDFLEIEPVRGTLNDDLTAAHASRQVILGGVYTALRRSRRSGRRGRAAEQEIEQSHWIGQVDVAVIIDVRGVETIDGRIA